MKLRAVVRGVCILAAGLLSGACSKTTLEIESTYAWKGTLTENGEKREISGTGSTSMDMSSDTFCWFITKQTDQGRLAVYAKFKGWMGTDLGGWRETYAAGAGVKACSGDK